MLDRLGTVMALVGIATAGMTASCGSDAEPAPAQLAYAENPASYTVGLSLENTPTSRGGAIASYSVSPALPPGLTLDVRTGLISGTPTYPTGRAEYTVTGANGSGRTTVALTLEVLPGFVTTAGQMTTERMRGPTATPLSNGLVLIAGGIGYSGELLPRAELYDPETQQFTATGSMNAEQSGFQAVLLPDGKVLMICGQDGDGEPIERPEVYDTVSGSFVPTGAMIRPRILCAAALLGNGRVLVAGGMTTRMAGGVTRTAELYDPETGSFSATGDMTIERFDAMAALTGSHVLVAGGLGATYFPTAVAELYDPVTGTFSPVGDMTTARRYAAATRIPGSDAVLVVGGEDVDGNVLGTAELYDPSILTFVATGSLADNRRSPTVVGLASGKVLVTGGIFFPFIPLNVAEVYDPSTGTFSFTGPMAARRLGPAATLLPNGDVLVAGGANPYAEDTAELYRE